MTATALSIAALFPLGYITAALSADRTRMLARLDVIRIRAGFGKPVLAITATPHQHEVPHPAQPEQPAPVAPAEVPDPPRPRGYRGAHRAGDTAEFHRIVSHAWPIRPVSYVESAT